MVAASTFKVGKQFLLDFLCAHERCLARVKARNFSLPCCSANDIFYQTESICNNKNQESPLESFLKTYSAENYRNTLARFTGAWGIKQAHVCTTLAIKICIFFSVLNLIDKWKAVLMSNLIVFHLFFFDWLRVACRRFVRLRKNSLS